METVTIQTEQGPQEISAVVEGPFAINLTEYTDGHVNGWTLTHRASGYALVHGLYNPEQCRELAAELADLDWNFDGRRPPEATRVEGPKRIKAFLDALKALR